MRIITLKPLQGAERPQVVHSPIASCHPDADKKYIEDFLAQKFKINAKSYVTHQ